MYNLNKIITTTINLDTIIITQNYDIIYIKKFINTKWDFFCKIFPCPQSLSENCEPVIVVSSSNELSIKKILTKIT